MWRCITNPHLRQPPIKILAFKATADTKTQHPPMSTTLPLTTAHTSTVRRPSLEHFASPSQRLFPRSITQSLPSM